MRRNLFMAWSALSAGVALLTSFATASAQAPTQAPQSVPAQKSNGDTDKKSGDVPLSKKLDESEGVLKPPKGVDPKMHQQPPANTGDKMPVIVPPGEPGGDQSVQPK